MTTIVATAAPGGAIGPVTAGERIEVLDVVRGFALFGILWMNMPGDGGDWWHNRIIGWLAGGLGA